MLINTYKSVLDLLIILGYHIHHCSFSTLRPLPFISMGGNFWPFMQCHCPAPRQTWVIYTGQEPNVGLHSFMWAHSLVRSRALDLTAHLVSPTWNSNTDTYTYIDMCIINACKHDFLDPTSSCGGSVTSMDHSKRQSQVQLLSNYFGGMSGSWYLWGRQSILTTGWWERKGRRNEISLHAADHWPM